MSHNYDHVIVYMPEWSLNPNQWRAKMISIKEFIGNMKNLITYPYAHMVYRDPNLSLSPSTKVEVLGSGSLKNKDDQIFTNHGIG